MVKFWYRVVPDVLCEYLEIDLFSTLRDVILEAQIERKCRRLTDEQVGVEVTRVVLDVLFG